jgi:hypothetical protein
MVSEMIRYVSALLFCLIASPAWAQCNGIFPAATLCGNSAATAVPPSPQSSSAFTRTLFANDYGAVCNGSTVDTTAFQNAINAAVSAGLALKFAGGCKVGNLTVSATLDFSGAVGFDDQLQSPVGTGVQLLINSHNPVYIHDYLCTFTPGTVVTGDICWQFTAGASDENDNSRIWNVVGFAATVIDFEKAAAWTVRDSSLNADGPSTSPVIIIKNTNNGDSGDSTLYANQINCTVGGDGINWQSSGGIRINNNKVNGQGCVNDVKINLQSGLSTGDIFIVGNSFEGFPVSGSGTNCILMQRQGATGSVAEILINSNQCNGGGTFVNSPLDVNGNWWLSMTVVGNTYNGGAGSYTAVAFNVASGSNLIEANNVATFNSTGSQLSKTDSSVVHCVIGPNQTVSSTVGSTVSSCTTISPF